MNIVIINGSARKGNTLITIDAFIKGASEKNEIEIIKPENHCTSYESGRKCRWSQRTGSLMRNRFTFL